MKRFLLFSILAWIAPLSVEGAISWKTNYKEAKALSLTEEKPMLLFFTGSDWSECSMKMRHEILNSTPFQNRVENAFVCMEVDFPKHAVLTKDIRSQNNFLKKNFSVREFPTLILTDSKGREISRLGYVAESGEMLAEDLFCVLDQDQKLFSSLAKNHLNVEELRELYRLASALRKKEIMHQVLNRGVELGDHFCSIEKYRLLVQEGEMKSDEAQALRNNLLLSDSYELHFSIAMIDFQELAKQRTELKNPHAVIEPLEGYLARFSKNDPDNIWRIEMMIAQFYLDNDEWQSALKHADLAYRAAPLDRQDEIAHSLDYMRSQSSQTAQK